MTVDLHAAITETLAEHFVSEDSDSENGWNCSCTTPGTTLWLPERVDAEHHQADRVMAVLADRLPHTPADQLATLIGGTVHEQRPAPVTGRPVRRWVIGPIHEVPDSPPAAPEPRQDTDSSDEFLAPGRRAYYADDDDVKSCVDCGRPMIYGDRCSSCAHPDAVDANPLPATPTDKDTTP